MARRRARNPWLTTGEVLLWVLFVALLFPFGVAGWAVGHYTSLGGKPSSTRTVTVTAPAATATTATTATATTAAPAATTAAAVPAGSAAGEAVFNANGCASCHTFKPAGATGTVGPDLGTAPAADASKDGMALAAFIRQSIVDPNAYISPGYPKGVMPQSFGTKLSKQQLDDLVAFLVAGSQ